MSAEYGFRAPPSLHGLPLFAANARTTDPESAA